jgi:hypothetical protein
MATDYGSSEMGGLRSSGRCCSPGGRVVYPPLAASKAKKEKSELHDFFDPFLDQPGVIDCGSPESEEREGRLLKQVVKHLISQTSVRALMRRIIQLNGSNGMKVFHLGQKKIHMLASYRTKDAILGRSACTGNNKQVSNTNLGKDHQPSVNRGVERLVEFLLSRSEQRFNWFNVDSRL